VLKSEVVGDSPLPRPARDVNHRLDESATLTSAATPRWCRRSVPSAICDAEPSSHPSVHPFRSCLARGPAEHGRPQVRGVRSAAMTACTSGRRSEGDAVFKSRTTARLPRSRGEPAPDSRSSRTARWCCGLPHSARPGRRLRGPRTSSSSWFVAQHRPPLNHRHPCRAVRRTYGLYTPIGALRGCPLSVSLHSECVRS
jgi:hypothetical protein